LNASRAIRKFNRTRLAIAPERKLRAAPWSTMGVLMRSEEEVAALRAYGPFQPFAKLLAADMKKHTPRRILRESILNRSRGGHLADCTICGDDENPRVRVCRRCVKIQGIELSTVPGSNQEHEIHRWPCTEDHGTGTDPDWRCSICTADRHGVPLCHKRLYESHSRCRQQRAGKTTEPTPTCGQRDPHAHRT
jgi:hypothetical protein